MPYGRRALAGAVTSLCLLPQLPARAGAQEVVRLPAADRPLTLRPITLYSVGQAEGAAWEMFASVMTVAFDARDNLYVLDAGNHRVVIFDRDGRHVRTVGRRGEGPGEFGFPTALAPLADGGLVVADAMRATLHRFAADGAVQTSLGLGEARMTGRLQPHPRGGVVAVASPLLPRVEGTPQPQPRELRWFGSDAAGASRLLFSYTPQQELGTIDARRGDGTAVQIRTLREPAFAPGLNWGVLPNGDVAVNAGVDYRISIIDAGGRTTRILERPLAPRPVTSRDQDAYREARRSAQVVLAGGGGSGGQAVQGALQATLSDVEFAERMPAIRAITADPFGRLWIARHGGPGEYAQGPIDLIDAVGGRYLGTLPPQPVPAAFSRSGRVAYVERDELDVPRVVVKQVPHAPAQ